MRGYSVDSGRNYDNAISAAYRGQYEIVTVNKVKTRILAATGEIWYHHPYASVKVMK